MKQTIVSEIVQELQQNATQLDQAQLQSCADKIQQSNRIFVAGAGRSGFVARAWANRLMHLGKTVFVVGDCTTPSIQKEDLMLIISGSGETGSLKMMAEKGKALGANLATITIYPEATIGSLADVIVTVPGATPKNQNEDTVTTIQPMGSAFEQLSWLICDGIILILMKKMQMSSDKMYQNHANLE